MTQTLVSLAAGTSTVKAVSGQVFSIQVTKAGAGAIIIYDNPSAASGRIIWQGDGTSVGMYDVSDGNGSGCVATQGITLSQTGTSNIVVVYN